MNSYLKILILAIAILALFHYKKYKEYNDKYQINQQELDYVDGNELYNELNPLVITFIEKISLEKNIEKYKLFSTITIQRNNFTLKPLNSYYQHNNEIMLLRSKKSITISLVNPKFQEYFKYSKKDNFKHFTLDKKNYDKVTSIDIIAREYNIIYIPRHWLFKIESNEKDLNLEINLSNNLFTYLFRFFN